MRASAPQVPAEPGPLQACGGFFRQRRRGVPDGQEARGGQLVKKDMLTMMAQDVHLGVSVGPTRTQRDLDSPDKCQRHRQATGTQRKRREQVN